MPVFVREQEMAEVSKRVGDKADSLAANLNMLDRLKTLRQDPASSKEPMLHLLYEWDRSGGKREHLVEALKHVELHRLADQYVYIYIWMS